MKQEKLCEIEDMSMEELGAENETIRRQLRDAEILASYPIGLRPTEELKKAGNWPNEWNDTTE